MKKTLFPFGSSSRNSGRAMRATSLRLENLEDRQLLSVTDLVPLAAAASESAVETAPAAEDVAIDLSSVAEQTETAYNEHDLAAVESLGMTADDSNVVWNAEGPMAVTGMPSRVSGIFRCVSVPRYVRIFTVPSSRISY